MGHPRRQKINGSSVGSGNETLDTVERLHRPFRVLCERMGAMRRFTWR